MSFVSANEICSLSATTLGQLIQQRKLSPGEIVEAYFQQIEMRNPALNAYILLFEERARTSAKRAEEAIMAGKASGPLYGIPLALKDLFDALAGAPSTFGSQFFAHRPMIPIKSAISVQRLLDAGANPLGKTNTPEFGYKGITDNYAYGPTSSPFDLSKNAGGSSGGSAAAVAAGLAPLAFGTDIGGSIRIPAAMCGVVGLKPTFGRIPLDTPAFLSHTPFLCSGPLARSVEDVALMMDVMAGPHPDDPFCLLDSLSYRDALSASIAGLRIGYSPNLGTFPVEQEVQSVVESTLRAFEEAGAVVEMAEVALPPQEEMSAMWHRDLGILDWIGVVECFKLDGHDVLAEAEKLDPLFLARLRATEHLSARAHRADGMLREAIFSEIERAFASYDLLLTPTTCLISLPNAQARNTVGPSSINGVSVDPLIGFALTYPFNYTGNPALSLPAGFSSQGFPIGLQIIGRRGQDDRVLSAAAEFERRRPWKHHYPQIKEVLHA